MANRPRPSGQAAGPSTPITAPVVTVAQLAHRGERMGYGSQIEFAAALGITQGYLIQGAPAAA